MNMQTHSDVTDNYRYVCNNSVKHNVQNSHWYAFVTDGDIVTACRKLAGLRDGTFFANWAHLTLQQ